MAELIDLLEGEEVGDKVMLNVLRNGTPLSLEVTLGGRYGQLD
jgi:hypothetical protein